MPPRECERLLVDGGGDADDGIGGKFPRQVTRHDGENGAASPAPSASSGAPPSVRLLLVHFLAFAISFSIAESALVVSVSLSARLFGPTGSACVGAMYVSYAVGTLFAGQVIRWTTTNGGGGVEGTGTEKGRERTGGGGALKPSLALGQACLVPFHLAGLWAVFLALSKGGGDDAPIDNPTGGLLSTGVHVDRTTAALLALCASASGAAAGIAWAAAGAFVTNTALALAAACDGDGDGDESPDSDDVKLVARSYAETEWNGELSMHDAAANGQQGRSLFQRRRLRFPLIGALLRTDFSSLAGNLTGLFNVALLASIFGGHAWSAGALRPETCGADGGRCVLRTYAVICAAGVAGVVMMMCFVRDPEVPVSADAPPLSSLSAPLKAGAKADKCGGDAPSDRDGDHKSSSAWSKVLSDVRFAFRTPQITALAWTHLASGFTEGLLLCFVGGSLVATPSEIGVLAGVKTAASALAAPVFALLGNDPHRCGRVGVLVVGAVAYMCAAALVMLVAGKAGAAGDDADGGDNMAALLVVYTLAGVGFSSWQGTAGGAFLSEIAASLSASNGDDSEREVSSGCGDGEPAAGSGGDDGDATTAVAAAFSASKALSGTATAIAFFVFSRDWLPYQIIVGWCFLSTAVGLTKVVLSERRGVWLSLSSKDEWPAETRSSDRYGSTQLS